MRLRPATAEDAPALAALESRLFGPDAWSHALLLGELDAPGRRSVVAVDGDEVVAYAVTLRSDDVVDLHRIAVHPDRQGRGIARALLEELVAQARAAGATRMLLEVSAANTRALEFYAAGGWVEVARRRGYYRDGTDAVVMRLPLGGAACGGRG